MAKVELQKSGRRLNIHIYLNNSIGRAITTGIYLLKSVQLLTKKYPLVNTFILK